jgi:hypothetical protein
LNRRSVPRRRHHLVVVGILLLGVALAGGSSGCAFDPDPDSTPPVRYNLTVLSTAGGSVSAPGEDTFSYDEGTAVNLVAIAASGYRFISWTGNVDTMANPNSASTIITIDGNYSITANFQQIPQYGLTISSTEGGSVIAPGEGTFTYAAGTVVNLVASPDLGYGFVNWEGNVGTMGDFSAATTTITVNGEYFIRAKFEPLVIPTYHLAISSTIGGAVTVAIDGQYTIIGPGQTQTISRSRHGHRGRPRGQP